MSTRYYVKPRGMDLEVVAYVDELPAVLVEGGVADEGHSVTVREVAAGGTTKAVIEGNLSESFAVACAYAEKRLLESRGLVFTEGHHFNKLKGGIYIVRRVENTEG